MPGLYGALSNHGCLQFPSIKQPHVVVTGLFLCAQSAAVPAFRWVLYVRATEDAAKPLPAAPEDTRRLSVPALMGTSS